MQMLRIAVLASVLLACALGASAEAAFVQDVSGPQSAANGIVLGPDGNLWVAEEFNGSVVRLTPGGAVVNRYATGGTPTRMTVGPGGRVWVTVPGSHKLTWFDALSSTPTAHDVAVAGCDPIGIAADTARIYFTRPSDGACNGGVSSYGTVAADGSGAVTSFSVSGGGRSYDLAVVNGKLFAPDFDGGTVRRLSTGAAPVVETTVTTDAGSAPDGITSDGLGNLWVTQWNTGKLARFPYTQSGGVATTITPTGGALVNPYAIATGNDGRIYVAGKGSSNVLRVSNIGGAFAFTFFPLPDAEPFGIVNGPDGDLFLSDQRHARLLRFVNTAPRATTSSASAASSSSAALSGSVDPRGNDTQVSFDYGITTDYGASTAPSTVPAGGAPVAAAAGLAGLAPSTTYHVRVRAVNAEGSAAGADTTFTTPPAAITPVVVAGRISLVKKSSYSVSKAGVVSLPLKCTGTTRCTGRARLKMKVPATKTRRAKLTTIATRAYSIAVGKSAKVKLKVSKAGRARLKRAHGKLRVTLTLTPAKKSAITRTIVLKAAKR